jgi:hypothetical protein
MLNVEGLNGFLAMKETMKEMGYDSDEDDEDEDVALTGEQQGAAQVPVQQVLPTGSALTVAVGGDQEMQPASEEPAVAVPIVPMQGSPMQLGNAPGWAPGASHRSDPSRTKYVLIRVAAALVAAGLITLIIVLAV